MRGCISNCHPRWICLCYIAWSKSKTQNCVDLQSNQVHLKETRASMTQQHANQSTRHFHTAEVRSCLSTLQAQNGSGKEAFWHVNFRNKWQRGMAIFKICFHPKSYGSLRPFISSTSHICILTYPDSNWCFLTASGQLHFFMANISCKQPKQYFKRNAVQDCHCFLSSPLPGAGSLA